MLDVLLVDDSPEVQRALDALLSGIPGVRVIGTAGDLAGALQWVDRLRPDLVVLDLAARGRDLGLAVLHHVASQHPATTVIVLSHSPWPAVHDAFRRAGAAACFDKALQIREACEWVRHRAEVSPALGTGR